MGSELVTSVLTLGLSIAFILVVAFVAKDGSLDDIHLMNTKALKYTCKPTDYKDVCYDGLAEVAKNTSATKKDYIFASFHHAITELQRTIGNSTSIRKGLNGKTDCYAKHARDNLKNCEKLLGHAAEDLQHVLNVALHTKTKTLAKQTDQIVVWLTAIRAYQTTCVDEIKDGKLKAEMEMNLEKAKKHTYNSEAIMYNVKKVLKGFGMEISDDDKGGSSSHRRLLEEAQMIEQHGFPTWVPVGDRRLLGGDESEDEEGDEPEPKLTGQEYFKSPEPAPVDKSAVPNVVVAKDGSGQFMTITEALAAYPLNHKGRYIIYIKSGEYDEGQIIVNRKQNNVYMYGDGCDKTIITGSLNRAMTHIVTSNTATFVAEGERFMARNIGFKNTIGAQGQQAVAFRSQAPHTVMVDCTFEGYQSTLYYHTHDQFYKNCVVSGTVDFIFGCGRAFFQDTKIFIRKPDDGQTNTMAADGRMKYVEAAGVVFHNCQIMATPELKSEGGAKSYLGRPWKPKAKVVVMKSEIGDVIQPEEWLTLNSSASLKGRLKGGSPAGKDDHVHDHEDTCMFREYANKGPGSNTD
ncbi:pectinesterase/pectinesterase inhibitor-like [Bidens hawaiensis]|uniref:pectinesterase/pectinesterase inhibitor-like n=1 Tax=Bidens hawaiensis TaxID=980011 RepID=UPI00404A2089